MAHDPLRAATLLREVLANDRARVGFFLGAGCPVSIRIESAAGGNKPLIPDIAGLSSTTRDALKNQHPLHSAKLETYLNNQKLTDANVEIVLSKIRALIEIVGNGVVHDFSLEELELLEKAICNSIATVVNVDLPDGKNGYRDIAAWIQGFDRTHPVEIFTTNYDLLIESALEEARLTYFDGFTGSKHPFFDVSAIDRDGLPAYWTRLWKLHGSINWRDEKKNGGNICRFTERDNDANSLIHPSHRKYDQSRRLPYLALLDRMKAFLRKHSAVLIISGYSFNDAHLNELMADGLESNPTSVIIATMYGKLMPYKAAISLAESKSNLILLGQDHGVVGKRLDTWEVDEDQDHSPLRNAFFRPEALPEGARSGYRECWLGDFKALGEFIRDVSGSFAQVERAVRS
ncbi:MAG TPA: SIR2 family protein [Rhizomicrobium sp.]|nr:SIR2 family protein [Rhizomicrobium sp.]